MANIRVEQRNARTGAVKYERGERDGKRTAKAIFVAMSTTRRADGSEEQTAILWTAWGRAATEAQAHLRHGSHVNVVGRLRNTIAGNPVSDWVFTCEQIDYLDGKIASASRPRLP